MPINNNLKCEWIKCSDQKTEGSWTCKKTWPAHMLPIRDPPENKRPTKTGSERLEENKPIKRTVKKKMSGLQYICNRLDKIDFQQRP